MIIKSAKFIISNTDYKKCPDKNIHEYAFIGRSNVGKSSLINMLTGHLKLAKTSSSPGKTQLINHFLINDRWFLVDLPGYGYAKISKDKREQWKKMINEYLLNRKNLVCVFVLIDSRIEAQKNDLDFLEWLGTNHIPFSIIFTKTDKQSATQTNKNIEDYKNKLLEYWETLPEIFISSSVTKAGKKEILSYIEHLNNSLNL